MANFLKASSPHPAVIVERWLFLVDELSASSAEELPGALQALGRAKVVGNRTAEGKGITPDVSLPYDIASLRAGKDPQLEAAIRLLQAR